MDKTMSQIESVRALYDLTEVRFYHVRLDPIHGLQSGIIRKGGFLVATVCYFLKGDKIMARGISLRDLADQFDRKRGRTIAFGRALNAMTHGNKGEIAKLSQTRLYSKEFPSDGKDNVRYWACNRYGQLWMFYHVAYLQAYHPMPCSLDKLLLTERTPNDTSVRTK